MNRLVRIALTLFVSATIMVFLVNRRLQAIPKIEPGDSRSSTELDQIHSEVLMINVGMGLAAIMIAGGLALIITVIVRTRKSSAAPHG
ncbi:hypothetical protein [Luteolibacter sp. Populi]|uniref:hypothetical protein n=1 Tax=Luteolibacter sp. Populi TaxID=3230487 RepID=UPI0034667611